MTDNHDAVDGKAPIPGLKMGIAVLAVGLVGVLVAVGALIASHSGSSKSASSASASSVQTNRADTDDNEAVIPPDAKVAPRPQCPVTEVAGVSLPCLGNDTPPPPAPHRPVVAVVWAWWCRPCVNELPIIDKFAAQHPEYTVIGIQADKNAAAGADLLGRLGVALPSLQDSTGAFESHAGLPGLVPFTVIIDANGTIKKTLPGERKSVKELDNAVKHALAA